MTNRHLLARAILSRDLATSELRNHTDNEWLDAFPGGVTTMNSGAPGLLFHISDDLIVAHGAHLDDDAFVAYCEALRVWQYETKLNVMLQLAPDLVVTLFSQDHPDEFRLLADVADHARIPIITFLGALPPRERLRWDDP